MIRLRKQGQREAGRMWRQVRPDDLDGTFPLGQLELTVSTLQREAARLSSAYLATFIASELGEPERPPALSVWDKTFGGNPLREGLRSAVIKAKQAIGDGIDPTEATKAARKVLVSDVGLFIDTAARESLRQGMEMDDRIVGYQRALKGTCGACSGSTSYEAFSENAPVVPLNVHPSCQCVAEPVVQAKSPAEARRENYRLSATSRHALRTYERANTTNISGIEKVMQEAGPIGSPVQVYRGTPLSIDKYFPELEGVSDESLVGKVLTQNRVLSTSGRSDIAQEFALGPPSPAGDIWELVVDPKVRGVYMPKAGFLTRYANEQELLLDRNVRVLITGVRREKHGFLEIRHISAKVLPQ